MKTLIFILALLPFLYFAGLDNYYHFKARKVSWAENGLHILIFLVLVLLVGNAFKDHVQGFLLASILYVILGSIDEFIFHRQLPAVESDVHAKEHWSFFIFTIVVWCLHFAKLENVNLFQLNR